MDTKKPVQRWIWFLFNASRFFLPLTCFMLVLSVSLARAEGEITFSGTELVGRPTDASITINIVPDSAINLYYEYGIEPGVYSAQTAVMAAEAAVPHEALISGLAPDTRYYYRLNYQAPEGDWVARTEHSFHTQRAPGEAFIFTITSDSHLLTWGDFSLYRQTLLNIAADAPDFHLDLGDFITTDYSTSQSQVDERYLAQRDYVDSIGHSSPIFLAVGNHENEEGWNLDDTADPANSKPVMSTNARKKFFLNPVPDGFYRGNSDLFPAIIEDHTHEDYFAWEWGDALFVVLDPFWYTTIKPYEGNIGGEGNDEVLIGDRWDWTLGEVQFNWLKQTLENSDAAYKFIFSHHITGGTTDYVRGGAVPAHWFEWGGYNEEDNAWAFENERPGWGDYAVHQLMILHGASAFFHGHDHQYAHEERDGIVYQLVPRPDDLTYGYGFNLYHESDPYAIRILPNSGHIRVTVSPQQATVEYVRAYLAGAGTNGEVAESYTILPTDGDAPPVLAQIGDQAVDEQSELTFTASATDADGEPLTYSLGAGAPAEASIDPQSGRFTWAPSEVDGAGIYPITLWVTDGLLQDYETIQIMVNEVNQVPTLVHPGDQFTSEGALVSLQVQASDDDFPADTLQFSAEDLPQGVTIDSFSGLISGEIPYTAAAFSPYSTTVTVRDGTGAASSSFTWTVAQAASGLCAEPLQGLAACWPMEEGSGAILIDATDLGNDGEVFGNPAWMSGKTGAFALSLDGASQYALVPDRPSLHLPGSLTLAAWLKPERAAAQSLIHKALENSVDGYELGLDAAESLAGQKFFVRFNQASSGEEYRVNSLTDYPTSGTAWVHVAAVYDGATLALYVNGDLEASITPLTPPSPAANDLGLGIGASPDGSHLYQGVVDEVLIYDRALSLDEILTLAGRNHPPRANDDHYSTAEDILLVAQTPGVLMNDSDLDGDPLQAQQVGDAAHGILSLHADGSFSYTPDPNWNGTDTFTYLAHDGIEDGNISTVEITVASVNDPPQADNQSISTNEDTAVAITLNASDVEGAPLTYSVVDQPLHGGLSGTAPDLTYTPEADYFGEDSFTFQAYDGADLSNLAQVSLQVDPLILPPSALQASGVSSAQIDISWQDNSDETAFLLERSPAGEASWTPIASLPADTITYQDSGLACEAPFDYRLRAYRAGDGQYSGYSNTASAATYACRSLSLIPGWNLITLPLAPLSAFNAETLLQAINSQGGTCTSAADWVNSGWIFHPLGAPYANFAITLGKGYFIKCSQASTWLVEGNALSSGVTLSLVPGYNLVGIPHPVDAFNAQGLLNAINAQGAACGALARWYNSGWQFFNDGQAYNNFNIEAEKGYFVKCSASGAFTP